MNEDRQPSFYRRLFSLVLPMAAQNLLNALVSASDALMLGFLDQSSLSAVSLAGQIFTAGGDRRFGFLCDTINLWCLIIPLGFLAAFVFKWSVPVVYLLLNLDEFTKMPVEWHHYHKYKWVRNLTQESGGLKK